MLKDMYPFWAAVVALVIAQVAKPPIYRFIKHKWDIHTIYMSGGMPSSHSALVAALATAVGLREGFESSMFAITAAFSIIVIYDAANVRFYSGQNIRITQQLIKDVQELADVKLENPIYQTKIKEVLGHKWLEVLAGIVLGICIALLMYWLQ